VLQGLADGRVLGSGCATQRAPEVIEMAQSRSVLSVSLVVVALGLAGAACSPAAASLPVAIPTLPAGVASALPTSMEGESGPLACDVVTASMINTALGATVAAPTQAVLELGGSTCDFKDAGISVRVFPNRDAAFLTSMKGSFSGAVDLPGVGDGAWYSSEHATIMVLKGTTAVEVQAPNQNDQAKLAALAAAIAAAL
jgi:hypothetical protein